MVKRGFELTLILALLVFFVSPLASAETSTLLSEDSFKVTETSSYSNTLDGNIKVNFKSISSGATIFIDGIDQGVTPRQIYLSPGIHTALITMPGQPSVEFDFNLETNLKYTYTIRFLKSPLTSKLKVLTSAHNHNALLLCQAMRGSGNFIYSWDFGDGYTLTTQDSQVSHTYFNSDSYKVKCTIYDESTGRQTQSQKTIVIRP